VSIHVEETIIDPLGRVVLDRLPFKPGEKVDVVVRSHATPALALSDNLRGSVLYYDDPFHPVAQGDWEVG
jgi:hypothetical protein